MTVPNCRPSWMASGSRAPQDAGDQGRAQTASSLTRATAMGGVVSCSAADTFPTLFPNDATSARDERLGQDDRSSSIPRSMRVAMSRALHQSAQTVAWAGYPLRETRRQLPGDDGARLHRPVAGVLIRQSGSRPKT